MHALRRGAAALHLALTVAVIVGVFAQVYLAGAYVFGSSDAIETHRTVGGITHGLEGLVFVTALIAWLPRALIGLSFLLIVIGTIQVSFSESSDWVGGLHALLALFLLGVAFDILGRRRRERARAQPATA
jgi:hypothetical protein